MKRQVQTSPFNVRCYINPDWREVGLARVAVARQNGKKVEAAIFLVDIFCLGVKDVMGDPPFRSMAEFNTMLSMVYIDIEPEVISFDTARSIVFGAVEYAKSLGFEPHPDFKKEKHLLGGEMREKSDIQFGGPDGRPLYMMGPYDQADEIVQTLEMRLGKDGFTVVRPE